MGSGWFFVVFVVGFVGFLFFFALLNFYKIRVLELVLGFLRFANVWGIGFVLKYV